MSVGVGDGVVVAAAGDGVDVATTVGDGVGGAVAATVDNGATVALTSGACSATKLAGWTAVVSGWLQAVNRKLTNKSNPILHVRC